jgi:hypothetical protein
MTVPAGGSANVNLSVAVDPFFETLGRTLYGGWITFTPRDDGQVYRVPAVGFAGDYQAIVAMPTVPLGPNLPSVLLHFDHQVQRLRMQIVDAATGSPVHPVFSYFLDQQMLARNSSPTGFFAFPWDGTGMHDNGKGTADYRKVVRDGQYKIVVKAMKALGDPNNPAHWETWTSPTITIDRP